MNEFIKSYKANKDYFSFKLSEFNNIKIEQLLFAQTNYSDTWEQFVEFMENIEVKEKSNVEKDVEHANESTDKNDTIEISDNKNKNQKDIELTNDNEKKDDEIEKLDNQNKIESKLEDKREMLTQNYNFGRKR